VYLAYSRTHNAEVALKIVNLDEASCNLVGTSKRLLPSCRVVPSAEAEKGYECRFLPCAASSVQSREAIGKPQPRASTPDEPFEATLPGIVQYPRVV